MDQVHQERDDHELSSPRKLLAFLNANTILKTCFLRHLCSLGSAQVFMDYSASC